MTETHILVPIDGSESAWNALDHALEQYSGGHITAVYVVDPMQGDYEIDEGAERPTKRSERLREQAQERVDDDTTEFEFVVENGRPAHAILEYADEADVNGIVMGNRGRSGLTKVLLGSVSETVVRRAAVPVTIVR